METIELKKKDFVSSAEVRWCAGCGDFTILSSMQKAMAEIGIPPKDTVVVSGIGCSSRLPYYINSYGYHTIHGRAPAVATGVKVANPELSVWVGTGDGDGLSIGGNHFIHLMRRNVDMNVVLFNNRIYGLTKGQYSPTSRCGAVTKTSPAGTVETPMKPLAMALASEATFVARTVDNNPKHMGAVLKAAAAHKGVSFVEVLQNCVIFNNNEFEPIVGRQNRDEKILTLEHGKAMRFGKDSERGIILDGIKLRSVEVGKDGIEEKDLLVHDAHDENSTFAYLMAQMEYPEMPVPIGVFRGVESKLSYERELERQINEAVEKEGGVPELDELLKGSASWEVH